MTFNEHHLNLIENTFKQNKDCRTVKEIFQTSYKVNFILEIKKYKKLPNFHFTRYKILKNLH